MVEWVLSQAARLQSPSSYPPSIPPPSLKRKGEGGREEGEKGEEKLSWNNFFFSGSSFTFTDLAVKHPSSLQTTLKIHHRQWPRPTWVVCCGSAGRTQQASDVAASPYFYLTAALGSPRSHSCTVFFPLCNDHQLRHDWMKARREAAIGVWRETEERCGWE